LLQSALLAGRLAYHRACGMACARRLGKSGRNGLERSHGFSAASDPIVRAYLYRTLAIESAADVLVFVRRTGVKLAAPGGTLLGCSAGKERGLRSRCGGLRLVAHADEGAVVVFQIGGLALAVADFLRVSLPYFLVRGSAVRRSCAAFGSRRVSAF